MKTMSKMGISILALLLLLSVVGCGKQNAKLGSDPVKLNFYSLYVSLSDQDFEKFFVEPIKKKFPNVTLNMIKGEWTGPSSPENVIASGESIDIIFTSNYSINDLKKLQLATDLNDKMKKEKFDLNKFDPVIIDALKKYGSNGEIFAVPFSWNFGALYYNKDVFDKFGVDYPKELSTWDDVYELSKLLTKEDGGVQFRGIISPSAGSLGDQLSLPYADNSTNKAMLDNDKWNMILSQLKRFSEIPGIKNPDGKIPNARNTFLQEKTVAMVADWADGLINPLDDLDKKGTPMNWDITTYPSFKEAPGQGRLVDFHLMMMSSTTKHNELIFEIMKYMSTPDLQKEMTKNGRMTVLNDQNIKNNFGANLPGLKGKNLQAAVKTKPAKLNLSDYNNIVSDLVRAAGSSVIAGDKDVNTALRDAQELANKAIAEELAKK